MSVTSEIEQERRSICAGCAHSLFGLVCGKCGCPIPRKARKASKSNCPLDKWVR